MIKNCMQQSIFIKRRGNMKELITKIEIGDLIPFDNIDAFSISLNGKTYTE